jgi:hypothetical protein
MARTLTVILLSLLLVASSDAARKRGERTGTIKEGIFTDSEFGFSITLYEKWKGTPGKAGDTCRLKIVDKYMGEAFERTGGTDSYFIGAMSKVEIWAFDSQDSVRDLIERTVFDSTESPLQKLYKKAIQPNEAGAVLQEIRDTRWQELAPQGHRGLHWSGLYHYAMRYGEQKVDLYVGVHLMGFRVGDHLLFLVVSFDPAFAGQVYQETMAMLETLDFDPDE